MQDSKPYILSLEAGKTYGDPLAQGGYHVVAKSEFSSLDDMKYYADECAAHAILKVGARKLGIEGMLNVYYSAEVTATISG